MAIMTVAQAKKYCEMSDKMIDVMDYLLSKGVVDEKTHRRIMLEGYSKLVEYLEKKEDHQRQAGKRGCKKRF